VKTNNDSSSLSAVSEGFESDISSDELLGDEDPEAHIHKYFQKFYENKYF